MKKLAYTGFWRYFDPDTLPLTRIIREVADIEITDIKSADYVLYSCFSEKHWEASDDSIKIFYTGENLSPDFNACDYAIGFDRLDFGDRYFRLPLYYLYADINEQMEQKHLLDPYEIKGKKTDFCSITVSNTDRNPIFEELFEALSTYKKVNSGGKWNNNVGGRIDNKPEFDRKHKFSIVCENSAQPGYTTEKLVQAFAEKCIPIYWGDPMVCEVFNTRAFINVQDYGSVDEVVEAVKRIDTDDNLYFKMLSEPALIDVKYDKEHQVQLLKDFLCNIFNRPKKQVYRRNRVYYSRRYIEERRVQAKAAHTIFYKSFWKELAANVYYTWLHPKQERV